MSLGALWPAPDLPSQGLEVLPCRRAACRCQTCSPAGCRSPWSYLLLSIAACFLRGEAPRGDFWLPAGPQCQRDFISSCFRASALERASGAGSSSVPAGTAKPMLALPAVTARLLQPPGWQRSDRLGRHGRAAPRRGALNRDISPRKSPTC